MKAIANLIWLLCGGLGIAMEYLVSSLLLMITIVGIPWGIATMRLGVLAVCLIGPCNGSTYMRYLYPVIACMPFAIGATITRSDLLWS